MAGVKNGQTHLEIEFADGRLITGSEDHVEGQLASQIDAARRHGRGAVAYKGMTVAGFPNWFTLMGPNTGPGHTSLLVYTEAQIAHVLQALHELRKNGWRSVEVRQDVQDRYNTGLQRRMRHMVWSGCKSWYLSDDGTNRALYPGLASEYVLRTRRFRPRDYVIERA